MSQKPQILFGLYGAGGFAREVMPFVRESITTIKAKDASNIEIYFVETKPSKTIVNGIPVISEDDFFSLQYNEKFFNIAIADSEIRERIATRCMAQKIAAYTLRATPTTIYDHNDIREGAIICAYSTVTSNVKIGKFFHSNIYSYIAHDCVIGDYVTFAPNVHCNGNVHIGDHVFVGTGAIIRNGVADQPLIIGKGAVIGMGAVVTGDVAPNTTVIGNPARVIEK